MNKDKVELGQKVIPFRKTATLNSMHSMGNGCATSTRQCSQWKDAVQKKQPFLFVAHQHMADKGSDRFLLSSEDSRFGGNYYKSSDFELFTMDVAEGTSPEHRERFIKGAQLKLGYLEFSNIPSEELADFMEMGSSYGYKVRDFKEETARFDLVG